MEEYARSGAMRGGRTFVLLERGRASKVGLWRKGLGKGPSACTLAAGETRKQGRRLEKEGGWGISVDRIGIGSEKCVLKVVWVLWLRGLRAEATEAGPSLVPIATHGAFPHCWPCLRERREYVHSQEYLCA